MNNITKKNKQKKDCGLSIAVQCPMINNKNLLDQSPGCM